LIFCPAFNHAYAQKSIDKVKFFQDTSVLNSSLVFNINQLLKKKGKEGMTFPAKFTCKLNDSVNLVDDIAIQVRGHYRRSYCFIPPLKLIYNKNSTSVFKSLKSLKLVSVCNLSKSDDENLLKEYLIYKMYNLISDKSFRVRLLNLNYVDSAGKRKPINKHAFLIEDVKDLAKRINCVDWSKRKFNTEGTDRRQMTIVSVFQYMIANTDWSVPGNHNITLIHVKTDSVSTPYAVPHDFDFSGLVGTSYALPSDKLNIQSVKDRLYRGYPRTVAELSEVINIFNKQKENIYSLINNFSLLDDNTKKDMIDYLEEFYATINNPSKMREAFVTNARTN
jgi:hypothetical protein